jgi:hypothetical protein
MAEQETRQVLPEVQAYITARNAAGEAQRVAAAALEEKHERAYQGYGDEYYTPEKKEQRAEHSREREATYVALQVATNEAWNTLGQSSDPLIRFIAEQCKDYQDYAVKVLSILPASVDEMDALAEEYDWCHIWTRFRDQAIEAGVMPGVKPLSEAYTAVLDRINEESCCALNGGARRRIGALLDALVAEVKAETAPAVTA